MIIYQIDLDRIRILRFHISSSIHGLNPYFLLFSTVIEPDKKNYKAGIGSY